MSSWQFGGGAILTPSTYSIDWTHPLTNALAWCRIFDGNNTFSPQYPLYSRYPQPLGGTLGTDNIISVLDAGCGIRPSSGGTTLIEETPNGFALQNTGTLLLFTKVGFTPSDGSNRIGFYIGNVALTSFCEIQRFTDNKWYMGFDTGGTDSRASVAGAGTFSQYDQMVVGFTYVINGGAGSTKAYVKGTQVATSTSPTSMPNLAQGTNWFISLNDVGVSLAPWLNAGDASATYWAMIWDRVLSADEIAFLQANPYAMFTAMDIPAVMLPANSALFRKTLSSIGSRIGSRQIQGYMNG